MDTHGLRRKDTTKGPALRVLSLDGGGVKGYSMFIILQEIMHRTFVEIYGRAPRRHELPKPCEHFDLIIGTGTGGLIALMLGRLRMDIETCKDVYVRMTRRVFVSDKTIAGVPVKQTLFKASELEDAIKACVQEHTIYENEGNDYAQSPVQSTLSPVTPVSTMGAPTSPRRTLSRGSTASSTASYGAFRSGMRDWAGGNSNTLLYDNRDNRTKTAVTAVYRGTPPGGKAVLLRSYDARSEPPPEFDCTIWQAGRATSAIAVAFKPIQVGQSVFLDEGNGEFNPAPQALAEARAEWPGRDIGVFISIGTGKPPQDQKPQHVSWFQNALRDTSLGLFVEARKQLVAKIKHCEKIHEQMETRYLAQYGVNPSNYFRFNVEEGVGEYGMNEWNRLTEISTNTRRYMVIDEVKLSKEFAAERLANVYKQRMHHHVYTTAKEFESFSLEERPLPELPQPTAIELPASIPETSRRPDSRDSLQHSPRQYAQMVTPGDKFMVLPNDEDFPEVVQATPPSRSSHDFKSSDPRISHTSFHNQPRRSGDDMTPGAPPLQPPPPLPPKTPLPYPVDPEDLRRPSGPRILEGGPVMAPYPPDIDGPPPVVNMARKPEYNGR